MDQQLGRGAMGAVFQATHLGTMRTVAVKVVVPNLADEAEFVQRFKREAEAAGRLRHPNVINVTDFGITQFQNGDLAYMVMEYLDGQTLTAYLKSDPRPPLSFIVDVVDQIALALDAAHASGIVHRDLKPSNIWLEPNRRGGYNVKVLDFGIAKVSGGAGGPGTSAGAGDETVMMMATRSRTASREPELPTLMRTPSLLRTTVGTLLGTPAYMAPEQCQGTEVDYRADIYSLATIVYEMLCGRLPFQAEDFTQLVEMQMHESPQEPHERDATVPGDLSQAVMCGLARDPAARPKSAGAFATRLRGVVDGEMTPIRQAKDMFHTNTNCFLPPLLACIGLVAVCLTAVWFLVHALFGAKPADAPVASGLLAVMFFGLVVFGSRLYEAACYRILKDASDSGQFQPRTGAAVAAVMRGLAQLGSTQLVSLLDWSPRSFRDDQLWAVVWAAEGRSGREALRRSRELCRELSPGALRALAVRLYATAAIGVTLFPAIFALTGGSAMLHVVWREELAGAGIGLFGLLYPLLFMIFNVNYGPAKTLLYWSALGSRGEAGNQTLPAATREDKRSRARQLRPSTVLWAALPLFMLAAIFYKLGTGDRGAQLQAASDDGRRSAVLQALNSGLPADYRLEDGETALFGAVRGGDAQLAEALLTRGANANARSHSGDTPLRMAAVYGRSDLAALLLEHGADPNAANDDGRTPLVEASMRGNLAMVRLLLAHGADRRKADAQNKTALVYAQEEDYPDVAAVLR
jgi:serine/threonine protein kinase